MPEPLDWIPVTGSSRIVAECYLRAEETILVRFPDGVEWQYLACPESEWLEFTRPGQSRGSYISEVLNYKPNRRWAG